MRRGLVSRDHEDNHVRYAMLFGRIVVANYMTHNCFLIFLFGTLLSLIPACWQMEENMNICLMNTCIIQYLSIINFPNCLNSFSPWIPLFTPSSQVIWRCQGFRNNITASLIAASWAAKNSSAVNTSQSSSEISNRLLVKTSNVIWTAVYWNRYDSTVIPKIDTNKQTNKQTFFMSTTSPRLAQSFRCRNSRWTPFPRICTVVFCRFKVEKGAYKCFRNCARSGFAVW